MHDSCGTHFKQLGITNAPAPSRKLNVPNLTHQEEKSIVHYLQGSKYLQFSCHNDMPRFIITSKTRISYFFPGFFFSLPAPDRPAAAHAQWWCRRRAKRRFSGFLRRRGTGALRGQAIPFLFLNTATVTVTCSITVLYYLCYFLVSLTEVFFWLLFSPVNLTFRHRPTCICLFWGAPGTVRLRVRGAGFRVDFAGAPSFSLGPFFLYYCRDYLFE